MKQPSNPFVGLRPFLSGESHLFFGRRGQINDVLTKLQQHRLLAVVGRSGCGKSSLVRAGLVPALAAGFLVDDREQWRICVTQPGSSPLRNLATALWNSDLTRDLSCDELTRRVDRLFGRLQAAGARAVFEHLSPKSHTTDGLALGDDENLLILVDQFEELFRFGLRAPDDASRDEAARFVTILLALAERRTAPIYVVITMRSDYLRDCDAFYGLPEAINRSLYLVPRLTREMRREIIEAPVSLFDASITPKLVERLLEDSDDECRFDGTEEEPDQLPVLQHALMRTWDHWQQSIVATVGSHTSSDVVRPINETDYEAVGTLRSALSNDANATLPPGDDDLPKRVFQALTETDTKMRRIRRAAVASEITAEVGLTDEQPVWDIVNRFRSDGRTFLVVYTGPGSASAEGDARIDISHESLIRRWDKLAHWVEEEAESADKYRWIALEAQRAARGPWPFLRDRALDEADAWWDRRRPNAAWGKRYCPAVDFRDVEKFLERSRSERDRITAEQNRQRQAEEARRAEQVRHQTELARAREAELVKTRELALAREQELAQAAQLAAARDATLAHAEKLAVAQKKRVRVLLRFSAVTLAFAVVALLSYRKASTTRDLQQTDRVYFSAVSEARDQLQMRPQHALLLAVQALKLRNSTLIDLGADNVVLQGLSLAGGRALAAHSGEIRNVAVTSKSDWLITASADGTVRRWDLKSATPELGSEELHNENRNAGIDDQPALRAKPNAELRIRPLVKAAVSPDDTWVAMGTESGDVKLRSLTSTTTHQLRADTNLAPDGDRQTISALAFVRNGRSLVAGFANGVAWLWNLDAPGAVPMLLAPKRPSGAGGAGARQISRIDSSGDGRWLALASADGAVNLWDVSGPHPRWIEMNQVSRIRAVAISTDSRSLFTGGADGLVDRWQLGDDGMVTRSKRVKLARCAVLTLAISADGRRLVTGGQDGAIRLWNDDFRLISELQERGDGQISTAEFSSDDRWLVTVSADGPVRLWDMRDPGFATHRSRASIALRGHDEYVRDVAFSPDGHWLVTGGSDATARLWDLLAPDPADPTVRHRGHETEIQAMTISPDLRWGVAATPNGLELIDGDDAQSHPVLRPDACDGVAAAGGGLRVFSAVKLSTDGRWLATLSRCSVAASEKWGWDLDLYDKRAPMPKHVARYHNVSAMDFSSDSDWMIAGRTDGVVSVLQLRAGEPTMRSLAAGRDASPITAVAVGGSKRHVAAVSVDGTVRLWNMTVEPAKAVLTESFGKLALAAIAISTDDRRLVVAARDPQNVATVWDLQAADVEASCTTLAHHSKALTTVAISPDSRLLITASRDGTARLYDLSNGFTAAHGNTSGCSPSADGRPNAVFVFDGHSGPIDAIRISPDNGRLITIDSEGIGRVWNLRTRSPKHVIVSTREDPIREAVFSRDGNGIITGSGDGTIRSVDLDVSSLTRSAREAIGRNLSRFEWCQSLSPLPYARTFGDLPVWKPSENIDCFAADVSKSASLAARFREWLAPAQTTTQAATVR